MHIRPVILSGGSGTRLWPVSRRRQPKQFISLAGRDCLFTATLKRVIGKPGFLPPMIVGSVEHKFLILDILSQLDIQKSSVLLEPEGRNTAAAGILAALADGENDVSTLHLVMPSDHIIGDLPAFYEALNCAVPEAENGSFVLFGIRPTHAEAGYGYILPESKAGGASVRPIASFKEKPDKRKAQTLIEKGALWNSGIFLYSPHALIAEAERLAPDLLAQCREAFNKSEHDLGCVIADAAIYKSLPSEPFDRVIMERTTHGMVVPCDIGWSDVGSWQALWELAKKDPQSNSSSGAVVTRDVTGSYMRSDGPMIAAMGIKDMMIIATKDAVLVTPLAQAQEVRALVEDIKESNSSMTAEHPCVMRPWGSYEGIADGRNFLVKQIVVRPGRSLSLQMHHHRAEHWIVVEGTAKVVCGDVEKMIFPNESTYIPRGVKHRLSNPGKTDLHLIEVQCGDYLGEDDIVRFEDNYGRTSE